jgi:hypothetical protein
VMIRFVTEMQDSEFFSEASRAQLLGGLGTRCQTHRAGSHCGEKPSSCGPLVGLRAFNAGERLSLGSNSRSTTHIMRLEDDRAPLNLVRLYG